MSAGKFEPFPPVNANCFLNHSVKKSRDGRRVTGKEVGRRVGKPGWRKKWWEMGIYR